MNKYFISAVILISSCCAWADRSLNSYLDYIGKSEAVLVAGTGSKLGVFDDHYYRVDTKKSIEPDYSEDITSKDFPVHFNGVFDAVLLERLPAFNFSEQQMIQMFENAYHFLKKGGKLVFNSPFQLETLKDIHKTADQSGLTGLSDNTQGIWRFPDTPLTLYLSFPYVDVKTDPSIKKKVIQLSYEEHLFPLLVIAGFEEGGLCDSHPHWINKKSIDTLICMVKI